MCGDGGQACSVDVPGSVAEALRMARSAADYLNSPEAAGLDGTACGEALVALGEIQAKLAAAHTEFLRRFDAADAHDADGYGTSSAWLAAKTRISRKDAQGRGPGHAPPQPAAAAAPPSPPATCPSPGPPPSKNGRRKLPEAMREETDKILLQADRCRGVDQDDLATIAGLAIERWRRTRPDGRRRRPLQRPLRAVRHYVRRGGRDPR